MALELFKPFIYSKLEEQGSVTTIKQAKQMVDEQTSGSLGYSFGGGEGASCTFKSGSYFAPLGHSGF